MKKINKTKQQESDEWLNFLFLKFLFLGLEAQPEEKFRRAAFSR